MHYKALVFSAEPVTDTDNDNAIREQLEPLVEREMDCYFVSNPSIEAKHLTQNEMDEVDALIIDGTFYDVRGIFKPWEWSKTPRERNARKHWPTLRWIRQHEADWMRYVTLIDYHI